MATLIIVTHELDVIATRNEAGKLQSAYILLDVLAELMRLGHHCRVSCGLDALPGDVALLHVDCTVVPDEYLALGKQYSRTINFGTGDISKRKVSRMLLAKGDSWDGRVVVKNDRNSDGGPERLHNRRAELRGLPPPHAPATMLDAYRLFDRIGDVDDGLWDDPSLVVERFVPERDGDDYALRYWIFMGPRERCTRVVTADAISKASGVLRHESVDVPDALRAERERLGFDYGKFDFVMHEGQPILLDANRTPGVATTLRDVTKKGARNLAEGLNALIEGKG